MDKQVLQGIREQLFAGGIKEIARRANTSTSAVTQVFQGKYVNYNILQAIIEVAREHKLKRTNLVNSLNEIVND